ncbi:hypothetical protein H257_11889 [Aphanomyces astaci]|uniref:Uncharacterized protein n=1 Tax=Aphanomyces astaci TaxID=112090 RepID=W4G2W1_APHAT|nr:hypothetical protein H257_11889 [Aphanomyces astaci]ETV73394.1 hypothetical protein H257_11889 [Aphanomyces astaci]|eukprot:XP_009837269.1 hypothetical protein H257_11889 [Aphanomyces astaci]
MGLLSSSVQPFVGTPFDDLRPLAYTVGKTDSLTQAMSRDLSEFYSTPDHVPQRNRIDALNISKTYLELDQAHATANQREVINREASKKLANQRSAAHTFMVSAISTNLRRLYQATMCPYELFEHIKTRFKSNPMDNNPAVIANYLRTLMFTGESCIDILSVELIDLVKRYRVSMTPPSSNPLDPSTTTIIFWNYYILCVMSDTFIGEKELWEIVTNSVATACAANPSVVVADFWNGILRTSSNERLLGVTTALPLPSKHEPNFQLSRMPPPQAITQADGSIHVLNVFTILSYAHRDCVNPPRQWQPGLLWPTWMGPLVDLEMSGGTTILTRIGATTVTATALTVEVVMTKL